MHIQGIFRIIGLLIALFSFTMFIPVIVGLIYGGGAIGIFVITFVLLFFSGLAIWLPFRKYKKDLKVKEGFLVVVLFWAVLGSAGALPLYLSTELNLSLTDSFFESFSALTTTGATVISGLDYLPKEILFYRQLLQWLGGMGIIVLAVAVLPLLGIGGLQLYRAEMPGPIKDSKLTPRIAETAKTLWFIYVNITIACALAFWLAGMSVFDAICHSFSTISIGGFSTYDASIGHFDSPLINFITVFFLLMASLNFTLHFVAFSKGRFDIRVYLKDTECKMFFFFQIIVFLICFIVLLQFSVFDSVWATLDAALFQSVSISTTAGFSTTAFADWPSVLPILLLFSSFIGGCAGSTGGGLKVVRVMMLFLQGIREMKQLVHPNAVYSVKVGGSALPQKVIEGVWGFFAAYTLVFVVCMLAVIAAGMDEYSAFSAVLATLNNLGPGVGTVAAHYGDISDPAKWILIVSMLFGRLEVFTLLVLLTPTFWRR